MVTALVAVEVAAQVVASSSTTLLDSFTMRSQNKAITGEASTVLRVAAVEHSPTQKTSWAKMAKAVS